MVVDKVVIQYRLAFSFSTMLLLFVSVIVCMCTLRFCHWVLQG
uniref:Uncharacterized protein n=1 Tax=Anguilla anguilla TaxID=7936 RepID=A0A0E9T0P1_ANGAN